MRLSTDKEIHLAVLEAALRSLTREEQDLYRIALYREELATDDMDAGKREALERELRELERDVARSLRQRHDSRAV